MRPVPSSKHILAVVIFAAVAATSGYLAWTGGRLCDEQLSFAAAAAKRHDPSLMEFDSVYGRVNADGRLRQLHTPVFMALMDMALIPTDYADLSLPFRVGVIPFTFLYLCGMYALLWRQCRSSTIATFVAILSMTVTHTFGDWYWGIGSLGSITPQGIVVAISPLILLSYTQNAHRGQVVLTFAALGLCGNLHLISAISLALVLLGVHLIRGKFSLRTIIHGVGGVVFFVLGALPYLLFYFSMRQTIAAGAPAGMHASAEAAFAALRISHIDVLYPELLKSLMQWGLYAAALGLLSGVMLWRADRFHSRDVGIWIWMIVVALFIALGLQALCQFIGGLWGERAVFIDFIQASCWVMLATYVLFALALTHMFRLVRVNRRLLRYGCAVLMIAWMLPSDNLRPLRHGMYRLATTMLKDADKPIRVQELQERRQQKAELAAIADWVKQTTATDAVFLTDQDEFRMLAQRSVYVLRSDVRHFYYLAPWLLKPWTDQIIQQYRWLGGPMDAERLIADIEALSTKGPYQKAGGWYIIVPVRATAEKFGQLKEIQSTVWGRYWRIFKIPTPVAQKNSPVR
jgi:hypothetical protein